MGASSFWARSKPQGIIRGKTMMNDDVDQLVYSLNPPYVPPDLRDAYDYERTLHPDWSHVTLLTHCMQEKALNPSR
jgi:hypothetical protein